MVGERKRKLSLFDVVDEIVNGVEKMKINGGFVFNFYISRLYFVKYFEILEKCWILFVW